MHAIPELQKALKSGVIAPAAARSRRSDTEDAPLRLLPLCEAFSAAPADGAAVLGFALGLFSQETPKAAGPRIWIEPLAAGGEFGEAVADGLGQYGADPGRLILVRARSQGDALWATERALAAPGARVACVIAPGAKPLSLTATRRLLLAAQHNASSCLLVRFDPAAASAAWTRWRVKAAPSRGADRELGPPAFEAVLERNRFGRTGQNLLLEWNAREHAFSRLNARRSAGRPDVPSDVLSGEMDVGLAAAPVARTEPARRIRAV